MANNCLLLRGMGLLLVRFSFYANFLLNGSFSQFNTLHNRVRIFEIFLCFLNGKQFLGPFHQKEHPSLKRISQKVTRD